VKVAASGDVNIRFSKDMPKDDAGLPFETKLTFGISPRLSATIGLTRGNPSQSITSAEAFNEVGYAIGAYLGVVDDLLPGSCMYRSNLPGQRVFPANRAQLFIAAANLKASDAIRENVASKKPIEFTSPTLGFSPAAAHIGVVRQGLQVPLDFKIKNTGVGVLKFTLVPDCGCFTLIPPGEVQPGQETTVRTLVNTSEYTGDIQKMLVLYSNDPKNPVLGVPVDFTAAPAYRLFRPQGDTVILPVPNNSTDILLTLPNDSKLFPSQFDWSGTPAKVTMEKWAGSVADPDMHEQAKPRHGYIFHVKFDKYQKPGRSTGTLLIATGDEQFPDLRYNLSSQTGIIASPGDIFMGEMIGVIHQTFLVSRPGKPFKVKSVDTGTKCLKATVTPSPKGDEYRVDLIYDGSAPKGDFLAEIKVLTDDPSQPHVGAMVRGLVL
jgi:hypothetical protein